MAELTRDEAFKLVKSHKEPDKQFYLDLLDEDKQRAYEDMHVQAVMTLLKACYINKLKLKIKAAQEEIAALRAGEFSAENYRTVIERNAEIRGLRAAIDGYRGFFAEPYFARMDLVDDKEGYNSYYIGKKGDLRLEIVDWRAPLARKYYQKSQIAFSINEYNYKLILRRALRTANGKFIDFKNEYLSLRDYLTREEIAGRDEEIIFDPYLKEILRVRKESEEISDIIETIQEKQYEIITKPERDSFVLQGCAGSGKTMIMLHRLSFLMYNNEDLKPRDVLVITPSNSFNAFIDELAQVLELEKVRTTTIDDYFLQLLHGEGVDAGKLKDLPAAPPRYRDYIYSGRFAQDARRRADAVFDGIAGMFTSPECRESVAEAAADCRAQAEAFADIRNAGVRVRRAVLGEIKEKPEGGLYYTKPYRTMMNEVTAAEEFLSSRAANADRSAFCRGVTAFYRAALFLSKNHERICEGALHDLDALQATVEKEIADLRRYKIVRGGEEIETYADRIARRGELLREIESVRGRVRFVEERFTRFCELFETLCGNSYFVRVGRCENTVQLLRLFYKETVRRAKNKFGLGKGLVRCDAFALCFLAELLGRRLQPRYGLVFVDEGQDVSATEYELLARINPDASFNIYGDLAQNITPYRGLSDWQGVQKGPVYELDQNYRNTNQIVDFVARTLHIPMQSIGFDGPEIAHIAPRGIGAFFREKKGLKAVIVSERDIERYRRKSYNVLSDTGRLSKKRINLMTVYESKGLEFSCVAVADARMTDHEKYIAYTRALKELAVVEERGAGRSKP